MEGYWGHCTTTLPDMGGNDTAAEQTSIWFNDVEGLMTLLEFQQKTLQALSSAG